MNYIFDRPWYQTLPQDQREMIELSIILYQRELNTNSQLSDYSFILFPIAKAYEGFLKLYLLETGLISQKTFEGKRFRIGRALNPDVREDQRDNWWLFDDVKRMCGEDVARAMWDTWLKCRNQVFHYFPLNNKTLNLEVVGQHLVLIEETITQAYQCKIDVGDHSYSPSVATAINQAANTMQ